MSKDRGWMVLSMLALLGMGGALFLLFRKLKGSPLLGPASGGNPIYIINGVGASTGQLAAPSADSALVDRLDKLISHIQRGIDTPVGNNLINSYELPAMGSGVTAARVCQALDKPFDVVLRVIGPPGSFATFAPSPNELDMSGTGLAPIGNTLIVPAGADHRLRLTPRQVLYGKGSVASVIVSVNASEAAVRGLF